MASVGTEPMHPTSLLPGHRAGATAQLDNGMPRISLNSGVDGSHDGSKDQTGATSPPHSPRMSKTPTATSEDEAGWGSHFWVTLVDPESQNAFYACPSTGQVSWEPPVGNFVLPPSEDGEWWELADETRGGIAYYYHTKTGETVWEKPDAFVIPLSILQHSALGKRLSQNMTNRISQSFDPALADMARNAAQANAKSMNRRSRSYTTGVTGHRKNGADENTVSGLRRSTSTDKNRQRSSATLRSHGTPLAPIPGSPYTTDAERSQGDADAVPPSPTSQRAARLSSSTTLRSASSKEKERDQGYRRSESTPSSPQRHQPSSQSSTLPRSQPPQPLSLQAAVEQLALEREANGGYGHTHSKSGSTTSIPRSPTSTSRKMLDIHADIGGGYAHVHPQQSQAQSWSRSQPRSHHAHSSSPPRSPTTPGNPTTTPLRVEFMPKVRVDADGASLLGRSQDGHANSSSNYVSGSSARVNEGHSQAPPPPASPHRQRPPVPVGGGWKRSGTGSTPSLKGVHISTPILNHDATQNMSPIRARNAGAPIRIQPIHQPSTPRTEAASQVSTGLYPVLPQDLASEIQQFVESDYAKRYFSTHRTGFIFKRRVPMAQMMTWQKAPLTSPLLQLNKSLHKDAVKLFKVIQRIMSDRDRDRPIGVHMQEGNLNSSTSSLPSRGHVGSGVLDEERWLLNEGLLHGELRDEIYCQLMKQLSGNPNPESLFRGWQLMCVLLITFPPSKNFEAYLRSFMQQNISHTEGRVDVMAKHCIQRLAVISKKGPRGKAPTIAEIETASDAAFNPSTFGESLDAVFRLQERTYPDLKVPIVLPFLADGILALGGTRAEGIFRVPGDGDYVSELKLRIDKGFYNLDGIDDPHILASLLKLWLRELRDPLIPDEMYNDCVAHAKEPEVCVQMVQRLPTNNRRVVLFIISFLQLFLEEKTQGFTKMTSPNLALVMSPNLLRCNSDSMAVVFTNAQYEQTFVHNLLVHLRCNEIDPDFVPTHGFGPAVHTNTAPRTSKSKARKLS